MIKRIFIFVMVFSLSACNVDKEELSYKIKSSTNIEEAASYIKKIEKLNEDALPVLIDIIQELQNDQFKLINNGKISACLESLLRLANKGVHSKTEARALLEIIKTQRFMGSTLLTAKILEVITGIDVGYNQKFVENYTAEQEALRQKMISKWEDALDE